MNKKMSVLFGLIVIASMLLSACGTSTVQTQVVTQVVNKVVTQVVNQVVTQVVETVVTATPPPATSSFDKAPDPTTLTVAYADDAATLDPSLAYEGSSFQIIANVMEGLIIFKRDDASTFVPELATEVPTVENGGISADGKTYTFKIRKGVKFSNGDELLVDDVAYSWERALLQSDPNSAAWMMLEAIMGYSDTDDVTQNIDGGKYAGDRAALIANAKPEDLKKACEDVKARFSVDTTANTFSVTLPDSYGPFLAIIARPWAYILDQKWATAQGDWDGSCDTWQNFYAPGQEGSKLGKVIMGTGPYVLNHWTPESEWVLDANPNYWRTADNPVWDGGPSGVAKIQHIVHKTVPEWGTRFAMFQTGDVAMADVQPANYTQVDPLVGETCDNATQECKATANPNGALREYPNLAFPDRADIFMNQKINTGSTGTNPYIGSGKLDGNGIPPNFFSDIHVRKAFAYCFDYDTYIAEGQNGDGVRDSSAIIQNMLGYNKDQEMYPFDLAQCKAEMDQAWNGEVAKNGFRIQAVTATGYPMFQTVLAILQADLAKVDKKYKIEIVTLPWASYLASFRATQLPIAVSDWTEDFHDPHNWVQPFLIGTYATRQGFSDDFKNIFRPLINQALHEPDTQKRAELYFQVGKLQHDNVPEVTLSQRGERTYIARWVKGYFYNPVADIYFYAFDLAGRQ
jgi:peptide/nickel transport system substrate-binding protein